MNDPMDFDVDEKAGTVTLTAPKSQYSLEAIQIAAHVFDRGAEVSVSEDDAEYEIALKSKRKASAEQLVDLGGSFLNELLNQEYRFVVGRFNQKISSLIVTRALLAARGGEKPRETPPEEDTPEFRRETERLVREAEEEIRRTMPRRLPPQGRPLNEPAEEHA
jgi:His-Xaa-Ser system protein HxsD